MKNNDLSGGDLVQPFQLESSSLRGRLVRLGPALDIILHQHAYPDIVGGLLAEAVVMAAALGTALKHEGVFTLQAKGDGPVRLLVADVTSDGGIRAYAQFSPDALPEKSGAGNLLGKGYLAFTYTLARAADENLKDERYQGIVELEGKSLAEAVQHYFRQSEQLPTGIMAAVERDSHGRWHAGCLMLQKMPRSYVTSPETASKDYEAKSFFRPKESEVTYRGGATFESNTSVEDDWYRAMMLMGTCTPEELTDPMLEPNELLYRLFHEEGVRVFDPDVFRHQCRCSDARVKGMLRSLPRTEVEDLAVKGVVEVTCEFCNKTYTFNAQQREILFKEDATETP